MTSEPAVFHEPRVMLITGGAGFIGCNYVRHVLANTAVGRVINVDALTYAGSLSNLEGIENAYPTRYRFVRADICDTDVIRDLFKDEGIDTVVHLAAESHVDRSIEDPSVFLKTNVLGTFVLLDAALRSWKRQEDVRFHHVSTDEVFGSLGKDGYFMEDTPYNPSSPYSASKAASDHLVRAWHRTYGLPVTLSNCSNNYGPYQFPEKLLPLMINNAVAGKPLPVYGNGSNVRDWLYVEDHCRAIQLIVTRGRAGCTYNVGGRNEWTNLGVVNALCEALQRLLPRQTGQYRDLIQFVPDRPGHDLRYAIDPAKLMNELGWAPSVTFEQGLELTVAWYLQAKDWLSRIRQEKYAGQRLGLGRT
jgi:dTDP-glucose 4,6-dehydratase